MGIQDVLLYLCNISQAYVQSTMHLNWDFFIKPLTELLIALGIDNTSVLKVVKLLYSVPEADNY
jgi:hypothetical protein